MSLITAQTCRTVRTLEVTYSVLLKLKFREPQPGSPTVAICLQSSPLENAKLESGMGFENGTAEVLGERDWN